MILTAKEIQDIITAINTSGINTTDARDVFLQFINPQFTFTLRLGGNPQLQVMKDIGIMNQVERLADGEIPLQIYLQNVAMVMTGLKQQTTIMHALDLVTQRISGAQKIDVTNLPETKELLIHKDDTLPYMFMMRGVDTAKSVIKINVPAYEGAEVKKLPNGTPIISRGTGWLLTPTLLITNHHVINARKTEEPDANIDDLKLQAKNAKAILDFDDELTEGTSIEAISIEAWDKALDYAIVRINDSGRKAIQFAKTKVMMNGEPIAVNIIQHPNGLSKRFGIRNNLVSASTDHDLRYFTDTESGSSGSPVFNDSWEAVALHRGATYVENVQFQGKSTAYVNVGTHLSSIFDHVRANYPQLADEIKI